MGLIPRTLRQFFQDNADDDYETEIFVSFIEIYNERVFDLLQNNNHPLVIKGSSSIVVFLRNMLSSLLHMCGCKFFHWVKNKWRSEI